MPVIEKELKLLIEEFNYNKLLSLGTDKIKKFRNQVNYYFDSNELALSKSGVTLRIRSENEKWLLCLKVKSDKNNTYISSNEYETEITSKLFEICKNYPNAITEFLPRDANQLLTDIINTSDLRFLGSLENKRHYLDLIEKFTFELDHSFFPGGKEYYELEIEGVTEEDSSLIFNFLTKNNINYNINKKSKYNRFIDAIS
jgi:uncharacterized protein YjbK